MDLENVFNVTSRPDYTKMSATEYRQYLFKRSWCSSIVKVTPEMDDILLGHSTWMIYQMMNRIYKRYDFNLDMDTVSQITAFSSYPG